MATPKNEIHVGDWGTDMIFTLKNQGTIVDVSTATTMTLKLKPGAGTTKSKTLSFVVDGSDGQVHYVVEDSTVFDVAGQWELQVYIATPTGVWSSARVPFKVAANL